MSGPYWQSFILDEGTLREPCPGDNRLVLWLPGPRTGGFKCWERLSTVAQARITVTQGVCFCPATLVPVRQRTRHWFTLFSGIFAKPTGEATWRLPNGTMAVQSGERQADLLLVWGQDETSALDESRLRTAWPQGRRLQRLGQNLFFITGIEPPATDPKEEALPPQGCPHQQIEQLLAAARRQGDLGAEAYALTDWGLVLIREGKIHQARERLDEALELVRRLGDRSRESDVLNYLGLAAVNAGQSRQAVEILDQALKYARATANRFAEKTALFHTGLAYLSIRHSSNAIAFFDAALVLAQAVGDRRHMAELLWFIAIAHAELSQRELAIARAQEVVFLLKEKGDPQAAWFAHHLEKYRLGDTNGEQAGAGGRGLGAFSDGSWGAMSWETPLTSTTAQEPPMGNPGLLRMAFTSAKAMAQFLGSGFKTVSRTAYAKRLNTCGSCEHHTGVRCRVCGCFTNVKASMFHEDCPVGRWPVQQSYSGTLRQSH